MLLELDAALASWELAPAQRPLHAVRFVARTYRYTGNLFLPRDAQHAPGTGAWAVVEMYRWYEAMYGDHLLMELGPGFIVLQLRDTLWRMRLPRVWGEANYFVDRDLTNRGIALAKEREGPAASGNLLCLIVDLTASMAASLTSDEEKAIWEYFMSGFQALTWLEKQKDDPLFERAQADYGASVESLMLSLWHNARWDTAQSAEKLIKAHLRRCGHSFPDRGPAGHDIETLGALARRLTGVPLRGEALSLLQCPTRLRYGETGASRGDALKAHRALLGVMRWLSDAQWTWRHVPQAPGATAGEGERVVK
jgi:HEPN domain-containing protein